MTFLTAQQYENYSYRFFKEDDGSFVVRIYDGDKHKKTRTHKTCKEVLKKYGEYIPELEKLI
ncbi:MAG: hypothetical protein JEY96_01610 [Bacteroidales bacterium]|nr:hypothetical protein [Bacteroidales bacterium]